MLRLLMVFIHVCGAMGLFGAAAIEGVSLLQLRTPGGTAIARGGYGAARRIGSLGSAVMLLSGIFLTQTVWGWRTPWIDVALAAFVVMMAIGATVSRRAMQRLDTGNASDDAIGALGMSFVMRLALFIGIVFLMTVKPPLRESVIAVAAAAGMGFLLTKPSRRRSVVRAA